MDKENNLKVTTSRLIIPVCKYASRVCTSAEYVPILANVFTKSVFTSVITFCGEAAMFGILHGSSRFINFPLINGIARAKTHERVKNSKETFN